MRMKLLLAITVPLLWLATLGSAVTALYMKHRAHELSFQLSRERVRRERLEIAWEQLQIEKSRLSAPGALQRAGARLPVPAQKEIADR
jgi:cell division protein FtsL